GTAGEHTEPAGRRAPPDGRPYGDRLVAGESGRADPRREDAVADLDRQLLPVRRAQRAGQCAGPGAPARSGGELSAGHRDLGGPPVAAAAEREAGRAAGVGAHRGADEYVPAQTGPARERGRAAVGGGVPGELP